MPIINSLFEGLGNFLGGSQKQDKELGAIQADSRRAGAHVDLESDEVTNSPARATPRKRGREGSEAGRGTGKKARPSEDEIRLTGYPSRVPSSAVKVVIPRYGSGDEEVQIAPPRQAGQGMGAPARPAAARGQHRFGSTLGQEKHAPKKSGPVHRSALQTQGVRNVGSTRAGSFSKPAPSNDYGDAFTEFEHRSKRQKTRQLSLATSEQIEIPDSQDDGGDFNAFSKGARIARTHSVISVDSQSQPPSQSQSLSQSKYFNQTESQNANQWTDRRPGPNRRKKGSNAHVDLSQKSSAHDGSNSSRHDDKGSKEKPLNLDDDDDELLQSITQAAAKIPLPKKQPDNRPSIDLGRDLDKVNIQKYKDSEDLKAMNNFMAKNRQIRRPSLAGNTKTAAKKVIIQPPTAKATARATQNNTTHSQSRISESAGNTRDNFMRAPIETPKQQRPPKATTRMQADPSPAIKEVLESPDELQNGTTVRSRSPEAKSKDTPRRSRPVSPSDIAPTVFKRAKHQSAKTPSPKEPALSEEYRIPIKKIYCRACTTNTGAGGTQSLDLVWDPDEKWFTIEKDGTKQMIPSRQEVVHIGGAEVRVFNAANGCTKVMLTGSDTLCSMGKILIHFADIKWIQDAVTLLLEATNDNLKIEPVTVDRMNSYFRVQVQNIQVDAQRHSEKNARDIAMGSVASRTSMQAFRRGLEDIAYEHDHESEPRRTSNRSRMQDRLSDQSLSQYFKEADEPRRSGRQSKPIKPRTPTPEAPPRWTRINKPEPWSQSVLYPPEGVKRVTVDFNDLERLDEGEFLNDNLISYALRRVEEGMAPGIKENVHFFNSFFFTSLTTKNGKKAFNYDAVAKWTKNKDLFNFPYIVVPINENLHWYVAIICNLPNLKRKILGAEREILGAQDEPQRALVDAPQSSQVQEDTVPDSQDDAKPNPDHVKAMDRLSISDDGVVEEAEVAQGDVFTIGDDGKVVSDVDEVATTAAGKLNRIASVKKLKKRAAPPPRKYHPDQPLIVTLDSFGSQHTADTTKLKDYLNAEAGSKRAMQVDRNMIQGLTARGIPQQDNFCDCGLFLVGYIEQFAKNPRAFLEKVVGRELDDKKDFQSFDPSAKRAELRDDLLRLYHSQDEARKALKKQKRVEKEALAKKGASSPAKAADPGVPRLARPNSTAPNSKASSPTKASTPKASWTPLEEPPPAGQSSEIIFDGQSGVRPGPADTPNGNHVAATGPRHESKPAPGQNVTTEDEDEDILDVVAPRALTSIPESQLPLPSEDQDTLEDPASPLHPQVEDVGSSGSDDEMLDGPSTQDDDDEIEMHPLRRHREVDTSRLESLENALNSVPSTVDRSAQAGSRPS